jgi:hypothetical protein
MATFLISLLLFLSLSLLIITIFLTKKNNAKKKRDLNQNNIENTIQKQDASVIPSRNKWLHPDDSFGSLEKGVVTVSTTYIYENRKDTNESNFEILNKE